MAATEDLMARARGGVALAWAVLAGLALWAAGLGDARAGPPAQPPERFVAELAARIVATLRDHSVGEAQRLERVDGVAAGAFDLDRTARIALGRYWKGAAETERREFTALFKDYVLTSYGRRFRQYADRTFRVSGTMPAGQDVVVTSLVEGGATPIRLDWRLAAGAAGWRVLDVSVEGVSLLVTFRNEFASVIERSGGRVAGLLAELRTRVAAERAQLAG
jgi:phospholipid transport system substrate-binding protein